VPIIPVDDAASMRPQRIAAENLEEAAKLRAEQALQ